MKRSRHFYKRYGRGKKKSWKSLIKKFSRKLKRSQKRKTWKSFHPRSLKINSKLGGRERGFVKLVYEQNVVYSLSLNSDQIAVDCVTGNYPFNPQFNSVSTSLAQQPAFYDVIQNLYESMIVHGSKCEISAQVLEAGGDENVRLILHPSRYSAPGISGFELIDRGTYKTAYLASNFASTAKKIKMASSTAKCYGEKSSNDIIDTFQTVNGLPTYPATLVLTNPRVWYWNLFAMTRGTTDVVALEVSWKITYYCEVRRPHYAVQPPQPV